MPNHALGYDNGLVKISPFRGGGLWVQNKEGTVPCPGDASLLGCIVNFVHSVLTFDPRCKHLTLPWSQGPRVVLVKVVVKAPEAIPSPDADDLVRAGSNCLVRTQPPRFLRAGQQQFPLVCDPSPKNLYLPYLRVLLCSSSFVPARVSYQLR